VAMLMARPSGFEPEAFPLGVW